jgi:pimeloyl-ACP methyl ester carboxylesterase
MGGYAVFEFLRQAPERVTRIALLGTSATPPSAARNAEWASAIALTEAGRFEEALAQEAPLMVSPGRYADPAWRERVLAMGRRVGPEAYRRQHRVCVGRPDSRPMLAGIGRPTLVLCGREDLATPLPLLEALAAAIPGARLCIVEDCGHLAPMEQPVAVTALFRDWLLHPPSRG